MEAADPELQSLLVRAIANHAERSRVLARSTPGTVVEEEDGVLRIVTSARPLFVLRTATVMHTPRDPAAAVARCRELYGSRGVRWWLGAFGDTASVLAPHVDSAGLLVDGVLPGMLLRPLPGEAPPLPPGLTIQPVRDIEALHTFNDTAAAGFGFSPELSRELDPPAMLEVPDLTYYVGRLDGRPVAVATRFTSHRVAGIARVSTVPEYRRRGVGEALTACAVADARSEGCLAAFLLATEMGYGVYERLGFRHVIDYHVWTSAAHDRPPTPG